MPKLRFDFWNKSFFKETAFGRTLSGRNKTGQTIGVVKDTALSAVPFIGKPLKEATGRITDVIEARQIGKHVDELNLSPKLVMAVRIVTLAVLGYLLVSQVIGFEEAKQLLQLGKDTGVLG